MNDAHTKEIQHMIEVMQAYADGEQIQCRSKTVEPWLDCVPTWSWSTHAYRIKPESELVQEIRKIIELYKYEIDRTKLKDYRIYLTGMSQGLRKALRIIEANGEEQCLYNLQDQ